MAEESPRITVSRDALRADLAEMELRLRVYFDAQLVHKADAATVVSAMQRIDSLDRGDFTPVHTRALTDFIDAHLSGQTDKAWSFRERLLALVTTAVMLVSMSISVLVAGHTGVL